MNVNVIGRRFGRLVVEDTQKFSSKPCGKSSYHHLCRCDCGTVKWIRSDCLLRKNKSTQSCGCLHKDRLSNMNTKSGISDTRDYWTYRNMLKRCYDKNNSEYHNYGARGVLVCDRWLGPDGFVNFISDMGRKPSGLTLDRIDNNGSYSPQNCRWATVEEQNNNMRRTPKVAYNGKVRKLKEVCSELSLPYRIIYNRLLTGWDVNRALSQPVISRGNVNG